MWFPTGAVVVSRRWTIENRRVVLTQGRFHKEKR